MNNKGLKESLRKWFGRKGAKGKTGGWVDCNAPDGKGGYKPCGRKKGEKRKYPACRPTPAGCKDKGKGKKWGKKSGKSKKMKKEDLMNIIREELKKITNSLEEKKDACYHKVKRRYKVWPSAYASGALSKCRKVGAANWGNKSKKNEDINKKRANTPSGDMAYTQKAEDKINKGINEHDIHFTKEDMATLHKAGKLEKEGNTYTYDEIEEFNMHTLDLLEMEVIDENITEAKYKGKTVTLNKPMRGDSKKFKVYVNSGKKNADGSIKVKKVNFGAKGMNIKKNNPKRRKAFRARHRCDNPGPKTMARYWSCKKW